MYVWENNWTKRHCPATKLCLITGGHLCFLHVSSIVRMVGNSSNGYSRSPEGHLCITHFKYQWRRKEITLFEATNQNEIFRSPGQHVVSSIGMFWLLVLFLFGDESKQSKSTSWMMSANRVAIPFSSICPLLVETRACLWVPPYCCPLNRHWDGHGSNTCRSAEQEDPG